MATGSGGVVVRVGSDEKREGKEREFWTVRELISCETIIRQSLLFILKSSGKWMAKIEFIGHNLERRFRVWNPIFVKFSEYTSL